MNVGDRIEMIHMPDDPDPIPAGTQGTVDSVQDIAWPNRHFTQVGVKWDNGRTLQLIVPPDQVRVLP